MFYPDKKVVKRVRSVEPHCNQHKNLHVIGDVVFEAFNHDFCTELKKNNEKVGWGLPQEAKNSLPSTNPPTRMCCFILRDSIVGGNVIIKVSNLKDKVELNSLDVQGDVHISTHGCEADVYLQETTVQGNLTLVDCSPSQIKDIEGLEVEGVITRVQKKHIKEPSALMLEFSDPAIETGWLEGVS